MEGKHARKNRNKDATSPMFLQFGYKGCRVTSYKWKHDGKPVEEKCDKL